MIQRQDEAQDFQTPEPFLELVRAVFDGPIGLDPCTVASNPTRARHFLTPLQDGLAVGAVWSGLGPIFMNPPYGRTIGLWTSRLARLLPAQAPEGRIALLPARTDTRWFHNDISTANAVCFLKKRIKFIDAKTGKVAVNPKTGKPSSGKFPSVVPYWGPNVQRFREVFGPHGWIP